jgi:hypothetical protein
MKYLHETPDLRIVATDSLQPHEQIDPSRFPALEDSLRREGILKDPPVVLPVTNQPDRYIVLDGATRTTAFQSMKIPSILVQVVRPDVDRLKLLTWNQVLLEADEDSLLSELVQMNKIELKEIHPEDHPPGDFSGECIARLALTNGRMWWVSGWKKGLVESVSFLTRLMDICREYSQIERTDVEEVSELDDIYPNLTGLLILRSFRVEDIVTLAEAGKRIPAGLTRFVVFPRALRLNYPIDILSSSRSLEEKQEHLEEWINQRIRNRQVRYYAESTYLYDS